jgi:uncharacterized Zn-binding protein involved in type VI secretion
MVSRNMYAPDIDMAVDHYVLSGQGPESSGFADVSSDGTEPVTIPSLRIGDWTISVTAYNQDDQAIGEGSSSVTIQGGKTTNASIAIEEYDGTGTFDFTVSWPVGELSDPRVVLKLTKLDSATTQTFEAEVDTATGIATYSNASLPVGSYSLLLELYDGDTQYPGSAHAVRIVKNQVTEGTFAYDSSALNHEGGLQVSIVNGIEDPFVVTLSRSAEQIAEGRAITVTATTNPAVACTYAWYVDGTLLSETGDEVSVGADLGLGYHFIDVLCATSNLLTSASTGVTVTEDTDEYLRLTFTSLSNPSCVYVVDYEGGPSDGMLEEGFTEDGNGKPVAAKMISTSGKFDGTVFLAVPESESMSAVYEENIPLAALFVSQSSEGTFEPVTGSSSDSYTMVPGFQVIFVDTPDTGDPQYIAGISYGENCTQQVTIDSYGDVGSFICGSFVDESFTLYSCDEQGYKDSLGAFRVEGSFRMKRSGDLYFYTLCYDSLGIGVDSCPENSDNPVGAQVYVRSLPYDLTNDYTCTGWNTERDGSGTTYQPGEYLTMPGSDTTLYAMWEND